MLATSPISDCQGHSIVRGHVFKEKSAILTEAERFFFESTQHARKTKLHPNYQLMNDLTEKSALKLQQATLPSFPLHPEAGSDAPSPYL